MRFNLMDNVVMRALSKICDMAFLNVLWVICSIPIVTIGASTTALYTVMLKIVRNEEGYIFRGFFKAFKENFKQSTVIWLIIAVFSVLCWLDFRIAGMMGAGVGDVLRIIFMIVGFLLLSVTIYVFPLTARYENKISATLKNALILTIAKLPYTVLMVAVVVVAVIASLWNTMTLMLAVPLWFLFGVSLIAWVNSYLLRRVFTVFEPEEDAQKEKEQ